MRFGTYLSENAEITYVWECISLKMLKNGMKELYVFNSQSAKRHPEDVLKMSYEDTEDI